MRFLIAFALIAAAAALPDSIILPKAALPALEEDALPNAVPIDLPKAELPATEDDAILGLIDISPMIVPEEVMEAVRLAQLAEIEAEPVKVVDNAEDVFVPDTYDDMPVEAVKVVDSPLADSADDFAVRFVDIAENAPLADESYAVHVVENAEDIPAAFDEQLAAGELEAIKIAEDNTPDAVRVVDAPLRRPGKIFDDPRVR